MSKFPLGKSWDVRVQAQLNRQGQAVLGPKDAALLEAIGQHRSITAAARAVGVSYRQAWNQVQAMNQAAGTPLVAAAPGGARGGGAQLTDSGAEALRAFSALQVAAQQRAGHVLRRLEASESPIASVLRVLHVAAAISFQEALGQIITAFTEHQAGIRIRATYGGSDELASQISAGAPCDVFISAGQPQIDELVAAGLLDRDSKTTIAHNSLVVIGPRGSRPLAKLRDLAGDRAKRVAIADPACPLGTYAQALLESQSLVDAIRPKAIVVDNSRAVLSAVQAGVADVGIAFQSDAAKHDCDILLSAPTTKAAVSYVAALASSGAHDEHARKLLQFLTSKSANETLRRCGLRPPRK